MSLLHIIFYGSKYNYLKLVNLGFYLLITLILLFLNILLLNVLLDD